MQKRKILTVICALLCASAMTGCSLISDIFIRTPSSGGTYDVTVVGSVNEIEDGGYYVEKSNGEYHRLYFGRATFYGRSDSVSPERVAWFGKDYSRIPTMHKGERIVYRSASEFGSTFTIERFEDIGYTVGISGLNKTSTGRYAFSSDRSRGNIDPDSSAGVLYSLGEHQLTIERIGGIDLRSGNISRAGTVIGLTEGKSYETDIYIGTDVMTYSLVADVRALVSMESYTTSDYKYDRSHVISFELPDGLENGYYFIDGFGFVRYINSDREYDESMDMNIPNGEDVGSETGDDEKEPSPESAADEVRSSTFRMDTKENVKIVLTYSASKKASVPPPSARVIGEYGVYTLNPDEDNTLSGIFTLPSGDYRIEISGLYGRSYEYKVIKTGE